MSPCRRRATRVVAIVVAAAAVGACSTKVSDEDKVKDVVTGFFSAVADGNGTVACAKLTASAVNELSAAAFLLQAPASCPEAIERLNRQLSSDDKKALDSAEVRRVTVTGDTAVVADADISLRISGQSSLFRNNNPAPITIDRIGDDWKISSLG